MQNIKEIKDKAENKAEKTRRYQNNEKAYSSGQPNLSGQHSQAVFHQRYSYDK